MKLPFGWLEKLILKIVASVVMDDRDQCRPSPGKTGVVLGGHHEYMPACIQLFANRPLSSLPNQSSPHFTGHPGEEQRQARNEKPSGSRCHG